MSYIYNLTDTWNSGATSYNGIKMAITNTASAATSYMLNLTVSGTTTGSFTVDRSGAMAVNTTNFIVDSSGYVGVGTTPSAWNSNFKALQLGGYGSAIAADTNNVYTEVLCNAYASSISQYNYVASLGAGRYSSQRGQHAWYSAGVGTAGAAITIGRAHV